MTVTGNYPLVSAIVSIYNSEKFVRGKIEDLLNQTIFDRLEIIIVNSGSTQNEDSVIKEYMAKYSNIKYIRTEERETVYKAWNRGIRIATGKYITNANTDDRLKNDAFQILANELNRNSNIALVHADMYESNIPNLTFDEIQNGKIKIIPLFDYLVQLDRCLVYSQPMWRNSLHTTDNIWFKDELKICGDHDFEIKISQKYKIKHLPIVLGVFYVDKKKSNISLNNLKVVEQEKTDMTKEYIIDYVNSLDETALMILKSKFELSTKIPIIFLRGKNIVQIKINPRIHRFTHEFVYYVTALIHDRLGEKDKAIRCCKKLLKNKNSKRVSELMQCLVSTEK